MSVVGSIAVNVVARTAAFLDGMKKSRRELKSFNKAAADMRAGFSKTSALVSGAIAGIAGGAVAMSLRDTAERLDEVAKTADRLGISTEALSGLQHGAGLAGVEVGLLNQTLQGMTKRVSEAAKGTGKAVGAIEELKLNAAELNRLSPDRMLGRMADALNSVANENDKVRLATKLFGDEGAKLLNFLAEGAVGMEKYRREAERMGLAVTREDIAKIEEMNDALTRLGSAWDGFKNEITINIAPAATSAIQALSEAIDGIDAMNKSASARGGTTIAGSIKSGFTGQWGWQKSLQEWITSKTVSAGLATGGNDAANIPGLAGHVRMSLRQPFSQEKADALLAAENKWNSIQDERSKRNEKAFSAFKAWVAKGNDKSTVQKLLERVSDGAERLFRGDAPGSLGQSLMGQYGVFAKLKGLKGQARDFGLQWQRDFMLNKLMGGGGAVGLGSSAMPMGGNDIAERGTQAAYQASKASDHVAKLLREQLQIGKQQVEQLAAIAKNTGGGDVFSMGAA